MELEEPKFCYNDIVYRTNKAGKIVFGVVYETLDVALSEDEEDETRIKLLKDKHISISWIPTGRIQMLHENRLDLYDRFVQKGDVVKRRGRNSQLGLCKNYNMTLTLRILNTNKVILNVDPKELIPLTNINLYDVIVFENWIGVVKNVEKESIARTKDGSKFILTDDHLIELDKLYETIERENFETFTPYVGLVVRGHCKFFDKVTTLRLTDYMKRKLRNKNEIILLQVVEINVISILVQWVCDTTRKIAESSFYDEPKEMLEKEDLKKVIKLSDDTNVNQYQGSYNHYLIKETDNIMKLSQWKSHITYQLKHPDKFNPNKPLPILKDKKIPKMKSIKDDKTVQNKLPKKEPEEGESSQMKSDKKTTLKTSNKSYSKKAKQSRNDPNTVFPISAAVGDRVATEVILSKTALDVFWQDGTHENDLISSDVLSMTHIDHNECFPGDFVIENTSEPEINVYGCIKKVDHENRTALITWMRYRPEEKDKELQVEMIKEEECSFYSILQHPEFKFKKDAFVIRVTDAKPKEVQENVGRILDIEHPGSLVVKWLNGDTSRCFPHNLVYVNTSDYIDEIEDMSFDNESWISISMMSDRTLSENESMTSIATQTLPETSKDNLDAYMLKIFGNPFLRIPMVFENFFSKPSIENSSELIILLGLCSVCENYERLLAQCVHAFNFQEDKFWHTFIKETTNCDSNKIEAIAVAFQELPNVLPDGKKSNDPDLERLLNLEGEPEMPDIELLKISEEFYTLRPEDCIATLFDTTKEPHQENSTTIECHTVCRNLNKSIQKFIKAYNLMPEETYFQTPDTNLIKFFEGVLKDLSLEVKTEEQASLDLPAAYPVDVKNYNIDIFTLVDDVPSEHHFKSQPLHNSSNFLRAVKKEFSILQNSLPNGICIKGFSERIDLFSVLIQGPKNTPYEDALFLFDLQLPQDYPKSAPNCYYLAFCTDRLNPNLYEEGKVCLSLLGTWLGEGTEMWVPSQSNLLQLLISIQSLILVAEPYYNEAGFEKQVGTSVGKENSRLYNEMVVIKTLSAMTKMAQNPPSVFKEEIQKHFQIIGPSYIRRLRSWLTMVEYPNDPSKWEPTLKPGFPLLPGSKGFRLSLSTCLNRFEIILATLNTV